MIITQTELINKTKEVIRPLVKDLETFIYDHSDWWATVINETSNESYQQITLRAAIRLIKKNDEIFPEINTSIGQASVQALEHTDYSDGYTLEVKYTEGKVDSNLIETNQVIDVPVVVMNYSNSTVTKYMARIKLDKNGWFSDEDIERWLADNTDYDNENCYYMCGTKDQDNIQFIDKTTE